MPSASTKSRRVSKRGAFGPPALFCGATKLLVDPDRLDPERLVGRPRIPDVVGVGEHRQLVACHRRPREALDDRRAGTHDAHREVDHRPATYAENAPETGQEIVPGDLIGTAQVERL